MGNLKDQINQEQKKGGFQCLHCQAWVPLAAVGTEHRNHCPYCLWSKHWGKLEQLKETCGGAMVPVGLTFKKEGIDKYTGQPRQGELMIVHQCEKCGKFSINRLAGDDQNAVVKKLFRHSLKIPKNLQEKLKKEGIDILTEKDSEQVAKQLTI